MCVIRYVVLNGRMIQPVYIHADTISLTLNNFSLLHSIKGYLLKQSILFHDSIGTCIGVTLFTSFNIVMHPGMHYNKVKNHIYLKEYKARFCKLK